MTHFLKVSRLIGENKAPLVTVNEDESVREALIKMGNQYSQLPVLCKSGGPAIITAEKVCQSALLIPPRELLSVLVGTIADDTHLVDPNDDLFGHFKELAESAAILVGENGRLQQ